MQNCYGYSSTGGIVGRLRIVFLSMALILLAAVGSGLVQLRGLHKSVDGLTLFAVPVLEQAEDLERNLTDMLLELQEFGNLDSLQGLDSTREELSQRLLILHAAVAAFTDIGLPTEDMAQSLTKIEAGGFDTLDTKAALLHHSGALDALSMQLGQWLDDVNLLLQTLAFTAESTRRATHEETLTDAFASTQMIEERYRQELLWANAITAVSSEIYASVDLAKGLRNLPNRGELDQATSVLLFKKQGIAHALASLPPSDERAQLAASVMALRALIFGEEGIIDQAGEAIALRAELDRNTYQQLQTVTEFFAVSQNIRRAARKQVDAANQDVVQTSDKLGWVLIISAVLTLLSIGAAVYFIVERQINQRVKQLTQAVLTIAEGEIDQEVAVCGSDELGKIAQALEVFKSNARELLRSNYELEKFAYAASHDLRSPLRAIQDLLEWTIDDEENHFSAEGRQNITLVQQRVARLNSLLADLFTYSVAGQDKTNLAELSLAQVICETAGLLDPHDRFNITFTGLETSVLTYATPMRQILLNLVNNAIKHHDRDNGTISVAAHLRDGRIFCEVQDDGPGIDPKYHDKIFGLFQTLRSRDEVEGSGLGLAIVSKLVERYGGTISVRSDPSAGRGTRFIFDLPEMSMDNSDTALAA